MGAGGVGLRFLRGRGAEVLAGTRVTHLGDDVAWTANGGGVPYELAVQAIGGSLPDVFRASSLPTGDDGGLRVTVAREASATSASSAAATASPSAEALSRSSERRA